MNDIVNLSALELRDAIAAGALTSSAAVEAYLGAIASHEKALGAFTQVLADRAREAQRP